jgi:CelD/BcsL family acetyltransferase involved in cellulose biosynthesis
MAALAAVPEVSGAVRVLRVERGSRLLGLLPVERWRDDRGARVLGPAGATWLAPDHVDVVAAPGDRDEVARTIVGRLGTVGGWDLVDFEGLARDGALTRALRDPGPSRSKALPEQQVATPLVELRSTDLQVLFPSKNLRKQVTQGIRRVQRAGGHLSVRTSPAEVTAGLEVLMDLHAQRFGDTAQVFAGEARRRFHLEAGRRLAQQDMVRLYVLEQDGGPLAVLYCLVLGDRLHTYSIGSRHDVEHSPGRTLFGQMVIAAAEEGFTEIDLLRGDHDYKLRFATGVREDAHLRFVRLSLRGAARAARAVTARVAARAHGSRPS